MFKRMRIGGKVRLSLESKEACLGIKKQIFRIGVST